MTERNAGRELYCEITDAYGNSVKTDTVRLLAPKDGPVITVQPVPYAAAIGEKATVFVEAEGDCLSNRWYYRDEGQSCFRKSIVAKDTYTITVTAANRCRELYCVITDAHGNRVTTDTVSLVSHITAAKQVSVRPSMTVNTGDCVTYTLYVTNKSSLAKRVAVTDTIPANTTLTEVGAWMLNGRTLRQDVTILAGETVALSYTVRVNENEELLRDGVLSAEEATVDGVALSLRIREQLCRRGQRNHRKERGEQQYIRCSCPADRRLSRPCRGWSLRRSPLLYQGACIPQRRNAGETPQGG